MSEQSAPVTPVYKGDRRCMTCGKVHYAHLRNPENPRAGFSWADPTDGHVYQRDQFGVAS